jgi:ABC-type Fe3+ transport system substrate-binding protein
MLRHATLLLLLAVILGLPFALRPGGGPAVADADTVVVISPHNEAIRQEFELGFRREHLARTGRDLRIDWRLVGGTSEIARYLDGEYTASFRRIWTDRLRRVWSSEVDAAFDREVLSPDASPTAREAREAFLASDAGCGIDVFFGGGAYDFILQARAGRLVPLYPPGEATPDWMRDEIVPLRHAGDDFRDPEGRWTGAVLSSFGIVYNRDALARLGLPPPRHWADLADPRYRREIALADPTKSGSMNKAFENVLQQTMHATVRARLETARFADEESRLGAERAAVAEGWVEGLRLLQRIAANARYFTDSAQKVPIDVAAGNCAAGMCIDFYGRQQVEALARRGGGDRVAYISPPGGTVFSVDPIGLLRGAPHPEVARSFIEFVLSPHGQRLWNQKPGTEGGPLRYALRRLPVRRDAYGLPGEERVRSDPGENPYALENPLVYRPEWTAGLFGELRFILKVMALDAHPELVSAWTDVVGAGSPPDALAILQDLSLVDYAAASGPIRRALRSGDKVEELRLARELGVHFRAQYRRAAELARSTP